MKSLILSILSLSLFVATNGLAANRCNKISQKMYSLHSLIEKDSQIKLFLHPVPFFSPDGNFVIFNDAEFMMIYNNRTGEFLRYSFGDEPSALEKGNYRHFKRWRDEVIHSTLYEKWRPTLFIDSVQYSENSQFVSIIRDHRSGLRILDLTKNEIVFSYISKPGGIDSYGEYTNKGIEFSKISPDGKLVFVVLSGGEVKIFNMKSKKEVLSHQTDLVDRRETAMAGNLARRSDISTDWKYFVVSSINRAEVYKMIPMFNRFLLIKIKILTARDVPLGDILNVRIVVENGKHILIHERYNLITKENLD